MVSCEVCGGEEFEKHAGFMYCAVCQTQSQEKSKICEVLQKTPPGNYFRRQIVLKKLKHTNLNDYHEQEYEYTSHEINTSRKQKSQTTLKKQKKQKFYDDGFWTTWEGFNYILHGMSQELKKICGGGDKFEEMVLKLWAAYLRECQAAFTSKCQEKIPKLKFRFKQRDARILYNVHLRCNSARKRKLTSKSSSRFSVTSGSSVSKRSLVLQKGKVIAADYQDHLSTSLFSNSNLADETLESLGRSSEFDTTADEESADDTESLMRDFRQMFTKKDFKVYKNCCYSKDLKAYVKEKARGDMRFPGKSKLLSIIHLALLLTGSQVQLSDLLRFTRESHLSFAKVTHFFPNNMKFPRGDLTYIEVISDALMPTHLQQRSITGKLAFLLKIEKIPSPDMTMLVDRYCQDLNLPKQIAKLSKKVIADYVPPYTVPRSKILFPSYEAWAMVSIIYVMKLLFGLNDRTEIFLSFLASHVNSKKDNADCLFVFNDWQKYVECRKTVLTNFHYPTQEQLGGSFLQSSKNFLDVLTKESKDEYRNDRFIPYPRYYIEGNLMDGIRRMLYVLTKPLNINSFEFKPSLTPQISHMDIIIRNMVELMDHDIREAEQNSLGVPFNILQQNFEDCDIHFTFDPLGYLNKFDENLDSIKCENSKEPFKKESFKQSNLDTDFLFDCSKRYWILHYPNSRSGQLRNFKEEIFEKTPQNFQWFITECARMLEMNVRDIYSELLHLEKRLSPGKES